MEGSGLGREALLSRWVLKCAWSCAARCVLPAQGRPVRRMSWGRIYSVGVVGSKGERVAYGHGGATSLSDGLGIAVEGYKKVRGGGGRLTR